LLLLFFFTWFHACNATSNYSSLCLISSWFSFHGLMLVFPFFCKILRWVHVILCLRAYGLWRCIMDQLTWYFLFFFLTSWLLYNFLYYSSNYKNHNSKLCLVWFSGGSLGNWYRVFNRKKMKKSFQKIYIHYIFFSYFYSSYNFGEYVKMSTSDSYLFFSSYLIISFITSPIHL